MGWTFQDIDELTMTDVDDVFEYWKDNPPVPMMVRAYLGIRKEKPKKASKETLAELARAFGG